MNAEDNLFYEVSTGDQKAIAENLYAEQNLNEQKFSPSLVVREQLEIIEEAMSKCVQIPMENYPLRHHFANGMYAREIFMPTGTLITGRIKKDDYLSVISQGEVYEATEHGAQHIKAPYTFSCGANSKRLVYVLQDCVWTTIHKTDETDIDTIVEKLTHPSYENIIDEEVSL